MKIAVIGSINIDMSIEAVHIPLKGETVFGKNIQYIPGGKGANQAVAIAKLGGDVTMFGCVGDDSHGQSMIDNLKKYNIETKYIKKDKSVSTGLALITVGDCDNTIVVVKGANDSVDKAYIDMYKEVLKEYDMIVLQYEIPYDTVEYIIDWCFELDKCVIFNPAPAAEVPVKLIEKSTYVTPNEHEVLAIFNHQYTLDQILKKYPEKLIVTLGSKGITTCLKTGEIVNVPARKVEVVDTTGAGDTVNGALAYALSDGKNIKEALKYANIAASLSIQKYGAQGGMPTKEEVEKLL